MLYRIKFSKVWCMYLLEMGKQGKYIISKFYKLNTIWKFYVDTK